MEKEGEVLDTQTEDQEGETPKVNALTQEEIDDLKRRAEVSSQNFERAKRAEAEKKALQEEIDLLKQTSYVDETDVSKQLSELRQKLDRIEEEKEINLILQKYPVIADKRQEFDEFRMGYPGGKIDSIAKLFLAENELLDATPKRKGLEKAGTGKRTPPDSGKMSAEDAQRLRTNNYKEYKKLLLAGKIDIG